MAAIYATGPAHFYVGYWNPTTNSNFPVISQMHLLHGTAGYTAAYGTTNTALGPWTNTVGTSEIFYLGTCEQAPSISIGAEYLDVKKDLHGGQVADRLLMGCDVTVSGVFNSFNLLVLQLVQARATTQHGQFAKAEIGRPMLRPNRAFCLWVQFPRQRGGSIPCYRMPGTMLAGPDQIVSGGQTRVALTFHSVKVYDSVGRKFILYDHDDAALPPVPPTGSTGAFVYP